MNSLFSAAFTIATSAVVSSVTRVREMPLKKPRPPEHAERRTEHPCCQRSERLPLDLCTESERHQQVTPRYARPTKKGNIASVPQSVQVAREARAPAAAFRLRDERLHRELDTACRDEKERKPVDRAHARDGLRRSARRTRCQSG
jgi:hypothetical protein